MSYYGTRLPVDLYDEFEILFSQCPFVHEYFAGNITEFVREAVRMNLAHYKLKHEEYNDLEIDEDINKFASSPLRVPSV